MKKQFVIINYNTPEFVKKLIMSINKFVNDAHIIIFDNSDSKYFIEKITNVEIINNTGGDIINFNDFLSQYPKRIFSYAKNNNWASAKHCYTIQKCIDMINDNFILLDSDVLLKKDCSDLFDENIVYAGEIINQPNGIKRIAPYICYINSKLCKQNNINFFDYNYMHGLSNGKSDMYDTGGAFYIHTRNTEHLDIKIDDYIIHYGHGSWSNKNIKFNISPEQFFEIHKSLWSNN